MLDTAAAGRCCRSGRRWNETANMLQMRRMMVSATTTTLESNHHVSHLPPTHWFSSPPYFPISLHTGQ